MQFISPNYQSAIAKMICRHNLAAKLIIHYYFGGVRPADLGEFADARLEKSAATNLLRFASQELGTTGMKSIHVVEARFESAQLTTSEQPRSLCDLSFA